MDELVGVCVAYAAQLDEFPVRELELSLLKNAKYMEASHALQLLSHWYKIASTELLEVLERVIGTSVDTLSAEELLSAYTLFYKAGQRDDAIVRPKILHHLQHRVAEHLGQVPTSQLCDLVYLLGSSKDTQTMRDLELEKFV